MNVNTIAIYIAIILLAIAVFVMEYQIKEVKKQIGFVNSNLELKGLLPEYND